MNDRCIAILKLLQNGTFIKRQTLMDEFCVSERTIRRDIEFLTYHYNIQSFSGRYGGYKLLDINDYKEKKKENKRIKADTLKEILKVCDERQKPVIESIISDYINTIYLYLVSLKSFLSLILPLTYGKVYGRTGKKLRNKI